MNCLTDARVSTDRQVEKELSIPAQLQAMRQYATDRGWNILEEFVEAGVSARYGGSPDTASAPTTMSGSGADQG